MHVTLKQNNRVHGFLKCFVGARIVLTRNQNVDFRIANGVARVLTNIFLKRPEKIKFIKEEGKLIPITNASDVEGVLRCHTQPNVKKFKKIKNVPSYFLLSLHLVNSV